MLRWASGLRSGGGARSLMTEQGWKGNGPTAREGRALRTPAGSERTAAPAPQRHVHTLIARMPEFAPGQSLNIPHESAEAGY